MVVLRRRGRIRRKRCRISLRHGSTVKSVVDPLSRFGRFLLIFVSAVGMKVAL